MALSGSVTSTNGYTDAYGTRRLTFSWTATQSIENNTSTISWTLSTAGGYPYWIYYSKTKVVIDGTTVYYVEGKQQVPPGTIASGTVTLTHNSVGDRSFSASVQAGIYEHAVNCTASGTWTLNNIPRASSVSGTSMEFGQAGTLTVTRASSGFNDKLSYQLGTYTGDIGSLASGTLSPTISWTPPVAMMNAVPNATTAAVSIICQTYNGTTLIATKTSTVYVAVPSSVVPTASVSLSNTDATFGVYTQGISKCRAQTTAAGAYGSTIASIATTIEGNTYTGADITSNVLTGSGSVTVTTVVKDSRGRSATETNTISVSAYATPAIEFTVHRCDSGGNADDMGSYANVWIHATGTAIGSGAKANAVTPTLKMRQVGVSTWTDVTVTATGTAVDKEVDMVVAAADTYSWEFMATSEDKVSSISSVVNISVGYATIDFLKGGRGIAFGTTALSTGFKCAMDTEFTGGVMVGGKSAVSGSGEIAPATGFSKVSGQMNRATVNKAAGIAVVNFFLNGSVSAGTHTKIAELPTVGGVMIGVPAEDVYGACSFSQSGGIISGRVTINTSGEISVYVTSGAGCTVPHGTIVYSI